MTVIKGRKARSRGWLACAFLAAALSCTAADAEAQSTSSPADAAPSIGELIRAFETVVFGTEFQEFDNLTGRSRVWKWETPLRVVVRSFRDRFIDTADGGQRSIMEQIPVTDQQVSSVETHLNTLSALTGLPTEDAEAVGDTANFVINFVPRHQMSNPALADLDPKLAARMASQGGCYFASWPNKENGRLYRAVIVVNAELGDNKIGHCLLEEMTQALGLPNDVRVRWPSIFSEGKKVTDLSVYDRLFLRTLYDSRIKAGMSKTEGLRSARRILAERVRSAN